MSFWTPTRIEYLRQNASIATASEIGAEIGCSRNSVIGKCLREGIRLKKPWVNNRVRGPNWSPARAERRRKQRQAARLVLGKDTRWTPQKPIQQEIRPPPANAPPPRNLTILELKAADCRWPVTADHPMLFCGHAALGALPYCGFHVSVAYQPSRPRAHSQPK